ncbi:MAG: MFS transporter, partial [Trebonia sp.]
MPLDVPADLAADFTGLDIAISGRVQITESEVDLTEIVKRHTAQLGKRNFRLFWIGESTGLIGSNLSSVVVPLVGVKVLHTGTFAVALLTGATSLPWLVFGLIAGAWVDRFRKRSLMIICDLVSIVMFASIAISAWLGVLT